MTTQDYQTGDRIHYTGDMANLEGDGVIIKRREADDMGPLMYDIAMNDGRAMRGIWALSFEPGAGRRFWLLSEWQEEREKKITLFMQRVAATKTH